MEKRLGMKNCIVSENTYAGSKFHFDWMTRSILISVNISIARMYHFIYLPNINSTKPDARLLRDYISFHAAYVSSFVLGEFNKPSFE